MAISSGAWLGLQRWEWILLILTIVVVLAMEAVNTAIERLTDLTSPGLHPLAKAAKDIAAGAVFIAAVGAILIGILLFGPKLLAVACSF